MPSEFTRTLAASLDKKSRVAVVEGADNMVLGAGTVYVAPGGQQMKIVRQGQKLCLRITDDPPENHCKPSADYLFRSMAELYGKRALGVIMTGMGSDGVLGLKALKEKGACILAQDESSCVVFGMPLEALNAGLVDVVSPLSEMAGEIVKRVN
jgi:two-component system chemotaxis response regulator CheB